MRDWKRVLIKPDNTIRDAMKIIDSEALRIAVIVDKHNELMGVVTDGDIRRALINGKDLSERLCNVMNKSPLYVCPNESSANVAELMNNKSLLAIPVVENNRIVGLHTVDSLFHKPTYSNPIFLMAGGFGTRLRPLTDSCPKPMLKVGNKPILETLLNQFIKSGFLKFYISTHFLPEIIKNYFGDGSKWGVNITYVHESEPLGTGGALGLLPADIIKLPIILINGDVLTTINFEKLLEAHNKLGGLATMCVKEYDYQIPFGVVDIEGSKMISMTEKPSYRYHVNAGIYVLEQEVIESISNNKRIDMPSLLLELPKTTVNVFPIHDYWLDIGRRSDFDRAQKDILSLGLLS